MTALTRLRGGEAVFGLAFTYPVAAYAELAAWTDVDFLMIDAEHGVADEAAQLDMLRALAGTDTFALVRVRPGDPGAVARYLDFGADGVIVPDVRTAAEAAQIAFEATGRWTGGLRGDRYRGPAATTGQPAFVMALIESPEGVANIDAILAQPGIDAVMIGSGDLSTRLGEPGGFDAPAYREAVATVEQAARKHGRILGAKPDPADPLPALHGRGYRLFLVGRDTGLMRKAMEEAVGAGRALLRDRE